MAYTYFAHSNKLQKVVDTNTVAYGRGEFVNGSAQGYTYDNSGNLGSDLSKGISNVVYTWFGKPATVTYSNGNVIRYAYDAGGSKLGEFITENSTTKKLHYIGNIVLENQVVQYMSTPAGRTDLRNNESKEEFLIKDRLGNVRAVIADVPTGTGIGTLAAQSYSAGYEPADAATEEQYFDKVSEVREEKPGSTATSDAKAALLEGTQQATGTSILLKVMAGDKIAVNAENFYEQLQANPEDVVSGEAVMAQVLNAMAGGAGSLNGSEGGMANALSNGADPAALQAAYESLQAAETDSTRPRSYLNYLFFDEQMQLVAEHSRLWQADGEADWKTVGTEEAIEVPENGYIAVYLSNQGAEPVYYDNLAVTLTPGALLEEKHYYPYGLPIQGWGTAASGSLPNRQRYQGNEYREEAGLNWMDFHNRQYDPQLGRFLGVDALAAAGGQQVLSPYHAMACNPAMMVDPLGLASAVFDNGARPMETAPTVAPLWPMVNPNAALLKMEANALAWSSFMQEHAQDIIILNIYNELLAEYKASSASNNGVQNASGEVQQNQQMQDGDDDSKIVNYRIPGLTDSDLDDLASNVGRDYSRIRCNIYSLFFVDKLLSVINGGTSGLDLTKRPQSDAEVEEMSAAAAGKDLLNNVKANFSPLRGGPLSIALELEKGNIPYVVEYNGSSGHRVVIVEIKFNSTNPNASTARVYNPTSGKIEERPNYFIPSSSRMPITNTLAYPQISYFIKPK